MKSKSTSKSEQKSDLIQRVIAVKKRLPESGVTSLFIKMFPDYKPERKRAKITAVLQLRSTDATVIERLERIANQIENF